jgi:pimeloyl-ACP methyl ester carboxylesterase
MNEVTTRRIEANGLSFVIDEAGTGDHVALCLHGFPESRFSWRHQLPLLAGLGWRAIAPDLRGYGGTSRPERKADYRIDRLVDDAEALFVAAGAKRRLLIGHDWGAMIAWIYAIKRRGPLDGMVIMNVPHPAVFARVMRTSWRQRLRSWYAAFFQLPALPERVMTARGAQAVADAFTNMARDKSRFSPEVTDVFRRNALEPGAMTAMINYYRANADLFGHFAADLGPPIEVPTLIVWGEDDAAIGIEATEGYEPYVRDLTLKRLPGVSHWVQQEAPEAVNAILAAWLAEKAI